MTNLPVRENAAYSAQKLSDFIQQLEELLKGQFWQVKDYRQSAS